MESDAQHIVPNPRKSANCLSVLLFAWAIPIFRRGWKKPFDGTSTYDTLEEDRSSYLGDRLEKNWQHEYKTKQKPSLVKVMLKTFWLELLILNVIWFSNDVVFRTLVLSFLLDNLLSYFRQNSDMSYETALHYGTALFIVSVITCFLLIHYFFNAKHYAMRARVAVCSLIYRKVLRLSQKALTKTPPGKLVNLLSNDLSRFEAATVTLQSLWTSPLLTITIIVILWIEFGWAGVIGMTIIFLAVPLQSYVGSMSKIFRFQIALRTDERVRFMNEIIAGVQVIKFYVWEKPFAKLIAASRSAEMKCIFKNTYVRAIHMTINVFATRMALYCTILSIVLMHGREALSISRIFMISFMFTSVSRAMCQTFVRGIADVSEVLVAFKRIQMFLEYEENDRDKNIHRIDNVNLDSRNVAISMKNISAAWCHIPSDADDSKKSKKKKNKIGSYSNETKANEIDSPPISTLEDINIELGKGKLIGVVGEVGSGKTSLVEVILGELSPNDGSLGVNGSISYSCQEPWNFAATVRQNILFGESLDRLRYDAVIKCTALRKDLQDFAAGDQTMIGERGISLSGGQKARINLARAVYRKADIYLLDDPLSAVDSHVGAHLYNECIGPKGFLARQNATRILVTHQVHFLKDADWIVVLNQGKVEMQGTYTDILNSRIDFASILARSNIEDESNLNESMEMLKSNSTSSSNHSIESTNSHAIGVKADQTNEESGLLTKLEESSRGKVKGPLLIKYLQSAKQPKMLAFLIVSFVGSQILASAADFWAAYWIRNEENRVYYSHPHKLQNIDAVSNILSTDSYVYIYAAILLSLLVITMTRSVAFFHLCARASQNLHDNMFNGLVSASMRFFDVNPSGRILNRFSKDIGSVDEALPRVLLDAFQVNLNIIGIISLTLYANVFFGVIVLLLGMVFMIVRHYYLKVSQDLKRLEGMTKSPVFTHITATFDGLSTIRAFNAQSILQDQFDQHQNVNSGVFHAALGLRDGFGMSLAFIALVFVGCVIYMLLLTHDVSGDRVGLAITQSLALAGLLQWGVHQSTEVSNQLMSVERVMEYGQLEPEKQPEKSEKLPKDWPLSGLIEFRNVFYRHFVGAEPVLRQISFTVQPKEKIGIVGRTGAGKSSLIGCLFRLALVDGDILIDDDNTENIELELLRSRISIIPQDPVLFSGSLRRNLDPFEEYSDDTIWQALDNVELKELFSAANGLQTEVAAHGSNFSVGQRQLLCLARALLRSNRILVLDEATANVDSRTDLMIQKTIREKFADCTVLTVAHRLHTIIDSDRIMVLDTGSLVEFDDPQTLLKNEKGIFYSMVKATGPQESEKLMHLANEKCDNSRNL